MKVRLFKPSVGEDEIEAIREVFDRAWLGLGPRVSEFEQAWSDYIGSACAVAVNSGTAALHLALAVFGFPRGSKVLVPALTFVSTASAALYNGLEPIFVDVDEATLGMDLDDLERKITHDSVAVIPVHMGGAAVPMDRLNDIAQRHGLKVIEDCAHCAGGEYRGRKLGTWGDIGCFSFEEKKAMTTGDGGMLCASDPELLATAPARRWLGIDKDTWKRNSGYTEDTSDTMHWYYEIALVGYKYNMNDLCASIGLAQLRKLDAMNTARRRAIGRYLGRLHDAPDLKPLIPYDTEKGCEHLFGVRAPRRGELIRHLKRREIATGVHYTPLPLHPLFRDHSEPTPVALAVYDSLLTLPLFADITAQEVDYVADAILEFG